MAKRSFSYATILATLQFPLMIYSGVTDRIWWCAFMAWGLGWNMSIMESYFDKWSKEIK